jgi:GNAT superfamily N-acetyltransferase
VLHGPVFVRDADPEDAPALLEAWAESVGDKGGDRLEPPSDVAAAVARIRTDPVERLVVGLSDGQIAGVAHLRRAPITPIHDEDAVHVAHLHVRKNFRGRGVGKALLGEAALWAEEKDSKHVMTVAAANARDCNRFLARLGLAQVAVVRASSVSSLRLKLAAAQTSSAVAPVVASRRSLHRRRALRHAAQS